MHYVVRPPSPGQSTTDVLRVSCHFTVRNGVSVSLSALDSDAVMVTVTMCEDGYDPPELYRQIFLDSVQLTRIVMNRSEVDSERVGVTGASQGGGLTLACAALEPRLKAAAPVYPFLTDYLRTWEMDLDVDAYEELRQLFRRFDPRHERKSEIFTRLGYIDVQHLASRIRAKVLMTVGLMDTVCPPSTQFAAYNKITAPKDMVIYPDYGHETLPGLSDRNFEFLATTLSAGAVAGS